MIEWVQNTEPVLRKIDSIRRIQGMRSASSACMEMKADYSRMQALIETGKREEALQLYFNAILPLTPPLLRFWLLYEFKDPRLWLQARTLYTETTALWSIMGYIS